MGNIIPYTLKTTRFDFIAQMDAYESVMSQIQGADLRLEGTLFIGRRRRGG